MEQPLVKIVGGREYAATGAKFGPSHLPVDVMAHMNKSAKEDLAMSAVVHDKQSPGVDTSKHLAMPTSPQRGPVTSTFRPLPKISKPNGSVDSLSLPISIASSPMEAAMVSLINSFVAGSSSAAFMDLLANMAVQTHVKADPGSDSDAANDNQDSDNSNGDNGSGDGGASSSTATTAADTTSTTTTGITDTPRRRRAAGGGGGGGGGTPRKPGGTPRKKPMSKADIEKRGSCERCKKSKAKCEPIPECIRCAKDGKECSLKETIMQDTGRRLGACQRCKKGKMGCKKIESCGRCHKAEQPCSWAPPKV